MATHQLLLEDTPGLLVLQAELDDEECLPYDELRAAVEILVGLTNARKIGADKVRQAVDDAIATWGT